MGMGAFLDPGSAGGGLLAGGAVANMAVGRIVIDTSSVAAARTVVVRESKLMGDALQDVGKRTDAGVTQATGALKRLDASVEKSASRAGVLWAAFITGGLGAAQQVKLLEMRFRTLSGSQEAANAQMDELRKLADRANQPFLSLVEGATGLMPALRGTNADLGQTVMLAQRLAMMDPAQGVAGASFAIREFLNGEYISLTRRLELDRKRLREILAEADGDSAKAIQGLSDYVAEIGISEQQLIEMGKEGGYAFQVLRDEGKQLLAEFFSPLLNEFIVPIVRGLTDMVRAARKLSPELTKVAGITAGLYGASAVAGRGLPIIGAIPGGGTIAKAAVGAAGLYGGAQLGIGLVRAGSRSSALRQFEGKSQAEAQDMILNTAKQLAVVLFKGFTEVVKVAAQAGFVMQNAFDTVVAGIQWGGSKLIEAFSSIVHGLALIPALIGKEFLDAGGVLEPGGLALSSLASNMFDAADAVGELAGNTSEYEQIIRRGLGLTKQQQESYQLGAMKLDEMVQGLGEWLGVIDEGTRSLAAFETQFFSTMVDGINKAFDAIRPPETDLKITDELLGEWSSFQDELADVERQARADRMAEIVEYNDRVAEETEDFNERSAKETATYHERVADVERDYARARARALEDRQRAEAEIGSELAEYTAEQQVEHQTRMAELAADYQSRREDAEEGHQEAMARIQRDARRDIARAARRLDATGVFEAQQRAKDQLSDEQRAFDKRLEELNEWLVKAQEQEQKSHEARLEEAREAADEQLSDLRERYEREEQLASANRTQRLAELGQQYQREMAELRAQHQRELAQLQTQHAQKMADITRRATDERHMLEQAFIQTFNNLQMDANAHQSVMIGIQRGGQAVMEAELRAWWSRQQQMVAGSNEAQYTTRQGHRLVPFQTGGRAMRTGAYQLEQGEGVLRPDVMRTIDRMMGGQMTQGRLLAALGSGQSRGAVSVNGMTVPVHIEVGGNPHDAARYAGEAVEAKVLEVLMELVS